MKKKVSLSNLTKKLRDHTSGSLITSDRCFEIRDKNLYYNLLELHNSLSDFIGHQLGNH